MVFLAIWGEGYEHFGVEAKVERVPLAFFTEDNGYSTAQSVECAALGIGESCSFNKDGYHTIVRIA